MENFQRMFYNKKQVIVQYHYIHNSELMNSYRYQSNTMNDSHKERRNSKWNVEMHGFLIQKQKKKNWSRLQKRIAIFLMWEKQSVNV